MEELSDADSGRRRPGRRVLAVSLRLIVAAWLGLLATTFGPWYSAVDLSTGVPIAEPLPQAQRAEKWVRRLSVVGLVLAACAAMRSTANIGTFLASLGGVLVLALVADVIWGSGAVDALAGDGPWAGNGLLGGAYRDATFPDVRFTFGWGAGLAICVTIVAFIPYAVAFVMYLVATAAFFLRGGRWSLTWGAEE
jgi:hypothetical protein